MTVCVPSLNECGDETPLGLTVIVGMLPSLSEAFTGSHDTAAEVLPSSACLSKLEGQPVLPNDGGSSSIQR